MIQIKNFAHFFLMIFLSIGFIYPTVAFSEEDTSISLTPSQTANTQQGGGVTFQDRFWDDWRNEFETVQKHFLNLVHDMHRGGKGTSLQSFYEMDILQLENEYRFRMDIPGMEKDEIEVEIKNNFLVIKGEREDSWDEYRNSGEKYYSSPGKYGSFLKQIKLLEEIDTSKVSANYEQGVLELSFKIKEDYQKDESIKIQID